MPRHSRASLTRVYYCDLRRKGENLICIFPSNNFVQTQRDWTRTYQALAHDHADHDTALRRRLIGLPRRLVQDVPRAEQADLRRRAKGRS